MTQRRPPPPDASLIRNLAAGCTGPLEPDSIFCAIVADPRQAVLLAENDLSIAFLGIAPINAGHTLVVPKEHARDIHELSPAEGASMFGLAQRVSGWLRASALPAQGLNFVMSNGAAAAQSVFHAHLHVIARVENDGFEFVEGAPAPNSRLEPARAAAALRLAKALPGP